MRKTLWEEFEDRSWANGGRNPRSGRGSNMRWTKGIREALPRLFETYGVKVFLDAPCGDWFWMHHVDLGAVTYIGGDIAKGLVEEIRAEHGRKGVTFRHMDVTSDKLPKADMMMCRDCLFHLNFAMRWAFYENFAKSGIPYLLSTINYNAENRDLTGPGWEPYNPHLAPFELAEPLELIQERGAGDLGASWREVVARPDADSYRAMAVWDRAQIVDMLDRRKG
jgi:hypothetical protein